MKDLKQVENYYKNNEIDMDQIIEDLIKDGANETTAEIKATNINI